MVKFKRFPGDRYLFVFSDGGEESTYLLNIAISQDPVTGYWKGTFSKEYTTNSPDQRAMVFSRDKRSIARKLRVRIAEIENPSLIKVRHRVDGKDFERKRFQKTIRLSTGYGAGPTMAQKIGRMVHASLLGEGRVSLIKDEISCMDDATFNAVLDYINESKGKI